MPTTSPPPHLPDDPSLSSGREGDLQDPCFQFPVHRDCIVLVLQPDCVAFLKAFHFDLVAWIIPKDV